MTEDAPTPPRVAPPRRKRCDKCGAFQRAIDRSPLPKAHLRRVPSDKERALRRMAKSISNLEYREAAKADREQHQQDSNDSHPSR